MIEGKVIFAIYLPPISLEVSSKEKQIPLKTIAKEGNKANP